jgi:hypothetical protein
LVLLDELVKVGGEKFENEAQMISVYERVSQTKNVVLVIGVTSFVQLYDANWLIYARKIAKYIPVPKSSLPSCSD